MDPLVISGISGRFPESDNMFEFQENLYNSVDMVTEDNRRWPPGLYDLPKRNGKIKNNDKFDAAFFNVHAKQANVMDPQLRALLEVVHETIIDSGTTPKQLRGKKVGVFTGAGFAEAEQFWTNDVDKVNGYELTGCCFSMFANRISYNFDFHGPSYSVDTACSSSMVALNQAVLSIRNNLCEAAVVCGVNILCKPQRSLQFNRLNMLSKDGKCKSFDISGDGYVRSEAIVSILIQKKKDAFRHYAEILNIKSNSDGYKSEGITFPSGIVQKDLLIETYAEANIDPNSVFYVEAHGTGTKIGDPQELGSIGQVFCSNRIGPLFIGSVKSNMGHSEAASGLCSLAKIIISMNNGLIPANLHFNQPNKEIQGLQDGKLKVVDSHLKLPDDALIGISSFGFGGANSHLILKSLCQSSSSQQQQQEKYPLEIPLLIPFSGRTKESLNKVLQNLDSKMYPIVQKSFCENISGNNFRGFAILRKGEERQVTINEIKMMNNDNKNKKELWFVFSGMGSQWKGMGQHLLQIPIFKETILELNKNFMEIDLIQLLTKENDFDDVVNSFVSIAAVQIGLFDLLTSLNIKADKIIGHSVGELACGYADGSLDKFQTLKCAYARGKAIQEANLPPGAMAAVGLTLSECKKKCPADIFPACHNSNDSITISGPVDSIEKFVDELKYEGIFAKIVNSSGNAFHSKYIQKAAPGLRKYLQEIILENKPRTEKWISTSIPESAWNTQMAQTNSVKYMVNNLISPVLFHEGISKAPENSVIIEIGPHSILNAVIKRSVTNCDIIGLQNKNILNGNIFESLGKIYNSGIPIDFSPLYPINGQNWSGPFLGPHVIWDHSQTWNVAKFDRMTENYYEIDIEKEEYLKGHLIDGRILYPATGYLILVWKTLAKMKNLKIQDLKINFQNVEFLRATILNSNANTKLLVNIFEGSGDFEVFEGGQVVCKGNVQTDVKFFELPPLKIQKSNVKMRPEDFYKELRLRGYEYFGDFQAVNDCHIDGTTANVKWVENNWVTFLDNMLQFSIVSNGSRGLYLPTRIQKVLIDPMEFYDFVLNNKQIKSDGVCVSNYKNLKILKCPGIEIRNLKTSLAPRRANHQTVILEKVQWTNYEDNDDKKSAEDILKCFVHIILENSNTLNLKVVELIQDIDLCIAPSLRRIVNNEPLVQMDVTVVTTSDVNSDNAEDGIRRVQKEILENSESEVHLLVLHNPPNDIALEKLKDGAFILFVHQIDKQIPGIVQIAKNENLCLFRKECKTKGVVIELDTDYNWLSSLQEALENKSTVFLKASPPSGVAGLVNALLKEHQKLRMIYSKNEINDSEMKEIFRKDLIQNVYKDVVDIVFNDDDDDDDVKKSQFQCGSYRHYDYTTKLKETAHAYVNTLQVGDLSSLKWIQGEPHDTKVCYAPLNFRDVMLATGKLPPDALPGKLALQDCILGLEFSGISPQGENVMGLVSSKGLALSVTPDPKLLWPVPPTISLAEASTIPVAYSTAYYALVVRGNIRPKETILIHGGAGGVGMAAIAIAQSFKCTIFTTVGSHEKKKFLMDKFSLEEWNFANSRDGTFEVDILELTGGRGVDLVLNSLSEELLFSSVRCLKENGRFLEIGKYDLSRDSKLGMSLFLKNVTFHGILLDALFEDDGTCSEDKQRVHELVLEGIKSGVVRPLPLREFHMESIEDAFRFMAASKHIGKVVVKMEGKVDAIPKTYFYPEKSYVIFGGLGGLGLEVGNLIVERGGKNLILCGRKGMTNGYQQFCLNRWMKKGVNVHIRSIDICHQEKVLELFQEFPLLGGVFNLTMVLEDNLIENQTKGSFLRVVDPKAVGTHVLDTLTADIPSLDHFVVFSSVSCGRGNGGQSNYAMANSIMERICEQRKLKGLPALAIQFGAIGDVGVIEEQMCGSETIVGGTLPQKIISCLKSLDGFLSDENLFDGGVSVVSSMVLAEKGQRDKMNKGNLIASVTRILGFRDTEGINFDMTMAELGLDSLMAVEVKGLLERDADVNLSVNDLRQITLVALQTLVNK